VIAEGVETEAQLAFLRELHCHYVQGYYFSKPLSAEETLLLLQRDNPHFTPSITTTFPLEKPCPG
jgi:EAL domain-containing protein (putative c-di-GMP-specific phosphodiesterase class I)